LLFTATPLKKVFNQQELVMYLEMLGFWAPVLFIFTFALITVVGLPGLVPTLAGGVVFGVAGARSGQRSALRSARLVHSCWRVIFCMSGS
jgi:hypothetical protein